MAGLWRTISPLRDGASPSWIAPYYDYLYEMIFVARSVDDVAQRAIQHAYRTFRPERVAVALQDGDEWNVLPWRQNGTRAKPLRIPVVDDPNGPPYEPGTVLEIPDVHALAARFPSQAPIAARGITSVLLASFGSRVHGRGFLSFGSASPQFYSDEELMLLCLHGLTLGIGLDHVEGFAG